MSRHHDAITHTLLRFLMWTALLICVTAPPTFGQATYWSQTYLVAPAPDEDSTDDPDEIPIFVPGTYVKGVGYTEDNYSSYGHQYTSRPTLTSPWGQTSSTSETSSPFALAEVAILFRSDYEGVWRTQTQHEIYCPVAGMGFTSFYGSDLSIRIAPGLSAYVYSHLTPGGRCTWVPTCAAGCSLQHTTNTFGGVCYTQGRIYRQCLDAYTSGICLVRRVVCAGRLQPGFCLTPP